MAVGDEASEEMNQEVERATVTRMFELAPVLELIDDRLNERPLESIVAEKASGESGQASPNAASQRWKTVSLSEVGS